MNSRQKPKGTPEDLRQAVNMAAGLSGQLITAALGMIGLQGAYLAFALDKKQCGIWFGLIMIASFFAFVTSVFHAGKGTTDLYKSGAEGDWDPFAAKQRFAKQSLLCFAGIALFISAVLAARTDKPPEADGAQRELQTIVESLKSQSVINQQILSRMQINQLQGESKQSDKMSKIMEGTNAVQNANHAR